MFELLYAGFDTMDVAFAGALPSETLTTLEHARKEAQERQAPVLLAIGPGQVAMHILGHGMRGGYAFIVDTGPTGAKWMFKNNTDLRQWNIFVSPRASMLLAYGYEGTRDRLWNELESMGAKPTDHSINRVDFAMDFRTQGFELNQNQFVAHSHTKVSTHWGKPEATKDRNQPSTVLRGRRLESVTIGKQPGRQIIVYDKRREAIERQKYFWFKAWGVDRKDPTLEVWRVEVRAGKNELKDKYQIRKFSDFEAGAGDVIVNALQEVRYLSDRQLDSNVSRKRIHPLWTQAQSVARTDLMDLRSGLTPDQAVEIMRDLAVERYTNLCFGNAIGLGISLKLNDEEIFSELPDLVSEHVASAMHADDQRLAKSIQRARSKLHFISVPPTI
jgi:hypothetical protein